jgi:hypothetical protein
VSLLPTKLTPGQGRIIGANDVTILPDGRRIDSRESALAWLVEFDATRHASSDPTF